MDSFTYVLASRPHGLPKEENFRKENIRLDGLDDNEVLLKLRYISVDPYMRNRMNDVKSYAASYELNQSIKGGAVAIVMESKSKMINKGDTVVGILPWATHCIENADNLRKVDIHSFPPGYYLGVLGMPGFTAYFGIMDIGKPQKGDTVVISGAAGAVGIVAGQIARIQGARVVGITGSDEKCGLLKEKFGFDVAVNYKTQKPLRKVIAEICPDGVDVYYDNVGGEITDAVVANLDFHSRIVLCGQISQYNNTKPSMGYSILPVLLTRSVLLKGFIVSNYSNRFGEALKQLSEWVNNGSIKYTETIIRGFDKLPEAFLGLFEGKNQGKMIVEIE